MTKRLQVLLEEDELEEIRRAAKRDRQTVSEWVRQALREAREGRRREPTVEERLAAIEEAGKYSFPTADIDQILRESQEGKSDWSS